MSNFKYKELNILKGIAFLFVFIVHFNQAFVMDVGVIQKILMYGQSGCQLFLLISGFLVANSFEKRDFNFKTYLKKKYINIAPGYILAVLFYVFLTLIAEGCQLNVPFKITNIYIYIYLRLF